MSGDLHDEVLALLAAYVTGYYTRELADRATGIVAAAAPAMDPVQRALLDRVVARRNEARLAEDRLKRIPPGKIAPFPEPMYPGDITLGC